MWMTTEGEGGVSSNFAEINPIKIFIFDTLTNFYLEREYLLHVQNKTKRKNKVLTVPLATIFQGTYV